MASAAFCALEAMPFYGKISIQVQFFFQGQTRRMTAPEVGDTLDMQGLLSSARTAGTFHHGCFPFSTNTDTDRKGRPADQRASPCRRLAVDQPDPFLSFPWSPPCRFVAKAFEMPANIQKSRHITTREPHREASNHKSQIPRFWNPAQNAEPRSGTNTSDQQRNAECGSRRFRNFSFCDFEIV